MTESSTRLPDKSEAPSFPYTWPTLSSENTIRVLRLRPATDEGDALHCSLIEVELEVPLLTDANQVDGNGDVGEDMKTFIKPDAWEQPIQPFEALSYACGHFDPSVSLHVDQTAHILITENLAAALRSLRWRDRDRFLWVDAICIDQLNKGEKSQQVGIMHKIYRAATNVIIWLGEADDHTYTGFQTMYRLASRRNEYGVSDKGLILEAKLMYSESQRRNIRNLALDLDQGAAICSISKRDYFQRRCCIQKMITARQININCGSHCID